jgi:hypothetical protein
MSDKGENLVLELRQALEAAELELRGVLAVASVHQQVVKAINAAIEWEHRNDADYYRHEGELLHPWEGATHERD